MPLVSVLLLFLAALGVGAIPEPSADAVESTATSPGVDCTPASKPTAKVDGALTALFSRQRGPGWVGGDSTYSTKLPDGQVAFVFSDTLIGTAGPNGSARVTGIAHNSELVGALPRLRSDYAGSYASPQSLIPDHNGHDDVWEVAATYVENGNQLVFVNEFHPRHGPFGLFTGRSGIAVLSLQDGTPTFASMVALPTSPRTQWGNAVLQLGGYTYIYGTVNDTRSGKFHGMKLARVPSGASLHIGRWQYWNGSGWVVAEGLAATLHTGNELTGVTAQAGPVGYEAVSIPGSVLTDQTVDVSYACSPQGPWSAPAPVYSIPRIRHEIAYIPTFHPELSGDGAVVVSYNINTTDSLPTLEKRVPDYQPRFLQLTTRSPVRRGTPTIEVADTDGRRTDGAPVDGVSRPPDRGHQSRG